MAEYRAYVIGDDDHIVSAQPLICEDDLTAIEQATALFADRTIEIWRDRKSVV